MKKLRSLKKRLKAGQDVEMEHGKVDPETDVIGKDKKKARKIALAHIKEIPDYYRRLHKMEKKGKKEWGIKEAAHEAVMALRRRQGLPPGTGWDIKKSPPISALVTKKQMQDNGELTAGYRDNLVNALVEWAMVWGAAPPPSPEKQIDKIRKYLS